MAFNLFKKNSSNNNSNNSLGYPVLSIDSSVPSSVSTEQLAALGWTRIADTDGKTGPVANYAKGDSTISFIATGGAQYTIGSSISADAPHAENLTITNPQAVFTPDQIDFANKYIKFEVSTGGSGQMPTFTSGSYGGFADGGTYGGFAGSYGGFAGYGSTSGQVDTSTTVGINATSIESLYPQAGSNAGDAVYGNIIDGKSVSDSLVNTSPHLVSNVVASTDSSATGLNNSESFGYQVVSGTRPAANVPEQSTNTGSESQASLTTSQSPLLDAQQRKLETENILSGAVGTPSNNHSASLTTVSTVGTLNVPTVLNPNSSVLEQSSGSLANINSSATGLNNSESFGYQVVSGTRPAANVPEQSTANGSMTNFARYSEQGGPGAVNSTSLALPKTSGIPATDLHAHVNSSVDTSTMAGVYAASGLGTPPPSNLLTLPTPTPDTTPQMPLGGLSTDYSARSSRIEKL